MDRVLQSMLFERCSRTSDVEARAQKFVASLVYKSRSAGLLQRCSAIRAAEYFDGRAFGRGRSGQPAGSRGKSGARALPGSGLRALALLGGGGIRV